MTTWRDRFRPIIDRVIRENHGLPIGKLRAKLREAFPAGPPENHPYKIWLDEIRVQLGLKKRKRGPEPETPLFGDET